MLTRQCLESVGKSVTKRSTTHHSSGTTTLDESHGLRDMLHLP